MDGYPHPVVPLVNAFVAVPRVLVGCFFLAMVGEMISLLPGQEEQKNGKPSSRQQKQKVDEWNANRLIEQIASTFNLLPAESDQSNFSMNEIQSGQRGEQVLASMIAASCPNVVSFWSLRGLDEQHGFTNADIDCVIAGQDKQGKTHLWFVDAKNYKGSADTAYRKALLDQG